MKAFKDGGSGGFQGAITSGLLVTGFYKLFGTLEILPRVVQSSSAKGYLSNTWPAQDNVR